MARQSGLKAPAQAAKSGPLSYFLFRRRDRIDPGGDFFVRRFCGDPPSRDFSDFAAGLP
jgi:hypothetical protein